MRAVDFLVLGYALLLGACADLPVRESREESPSAVLPAGPTKESDTFRQLFAEVSAPDPVTEGMTTIRLKATREILLMATMTESGGKGGDIVRVPVDGTGEKLWTIRATFPRPGRYEVSLFGKSPTEASNSYDFLARWTIDATSAQPDGRSNRPPETVVERLTPSSPGNQTGKWYHTYPSLAGFGMKLLEGPLSEIVGSQIDVVVTSDQDLKLLASVWKPGSNTSVPGMTRIDRTGNIWRIRYIFPETGSFRATISTKAASAPGNTYTVVAEWTLSTTVAPTPVRESVVAVESPPKFDLSTAIVGNEIEQIRAWLRSDIDQSSSAASDIVEQVKLSLFDKDKSTAPKVFTALAAAGLDPNMRDAEKVPLLFSAIEYDRLDVGKWLLARGADARARSDNGVTALHLIARLMDNPTRRQVEWARLLIGSGADINAQTADGETAVISASLSDMQHDLLVFLTENGADITIGDREGNAPLSHAVQHESKLNSAYLRSKGAQLYSYAFPADNQTPACRAVLSGDLDLLSRIPLDELKRISGRTAFGIPATPLHLAAELGNDAVLDSLCSRGVEWNVKDRYGRSPLFLAILNGRTDVAVRLLAHGADPNFPDDAGVTPFAAAFSACLPIAGILIDRGFVPRGDAAARAILGTENIEIIRSIGDRIAWTPRDLQFAAALGNPGIVEYLAAKQLVGGDRSATIREETQTNQARNQHDLQSTSMLLDIPKRGPTLLAPSGEYSYVLESWSPWMQNSSVKDFSDYPVGIHVPEGYDGSKPYGLVISMSNAKSPSPYPGQFAPTLERHNLIWVGFDPYNGLDNLPDDANAAFCLGLLCNMLARFNIDHDRIYIGGFSLGGQLTSRVLRLEPQLFSGAFFINIGYDNYSYFVPHWYYCKNNMPIVFVEGDYDYNRLSVYRTYDELLSSGFRRVHYLQEPMIGHKLISAESFERAIALLDSK
ncbi:MAG TPA: ankyrin repeat domain-containing protein [Spirochaetia bacterium]|nr:ankyrin repeat domain-containing protein [Spirochaetia bacterium]